MSRSELVVLAKEIHERILDKIEKHETFYAALYTEKTEMSVRFTPESINVYDDAYEIIDEFDSSIHIKKNEVIHIYKDDEIDGSYYFINFKNGSQMIIIL